ncbi:hypothetical protein DL96DRAFT_1188463 [Flagelloscypha sp. PMI_526]|nr:hypothetical protein DL96DRAFT_1188463 [Flagelloscypha sp. PMI_526]
MEDLWVWEICCLNISSREHNSEFTRAFSSRRPQNTFSAVLMSLSTQDFDLDPNIHHLYLAVPIPRRLTMSTRYSQLKANAVAFITHPHWTGSAWWTLFTLALSISIGAIVPKLALHSEHEYSKYCSGIPCLPYPPSSADERFFVLTNLRAHMIGTSVLLIPNAYCNYLAAYPYADKEPWETLLRFSTLWFLLGGSTSIGISILNSVSVDPVRMDPVKVLKLSIPGALCETLISVPVLFAIAALFVLGDWIGTRTWRVCGSGVEVV